MSQTNVRISNFPYEVDARAFAKRQSQRDDSTLYMLWIKSGWKRAFARKPYCVVDSFWEASRMQDSGEYDIRFTYRRGVEEPYI